MTTRIKKGDKVAVITGQDRGKTGVASRVLPKQSRVIVEGVNLRQRHQRPRRQGEKGQVVTFAAPLHLSNVLLWCDKCGRGVRTGTHLEAKLPSGSLAAKKFRVCRRCGKKL